MLNYEKPSAVEVALSTTDSILASEQLKDGGVGGQLTQLELFLWEK